MVVSVWAATKTQAELLKLVAHIYQLVLVLAESKLLSTNAAVIENLF